MTPERALTTAVMGTAAGIALMEAIGEITGLATRNPVVDISAFIALANVTGIPLTPMLRAIRERMYPGQKALEEEPENQEQ
ncbi:MAG TPA: hypothetical protein VJ227_01375 [Patescibacteria group bacterium]|nr:hypothetical protein [Patescibacteria group bacterium]